MIPRITAFDGQEHHAFTLEGSSSAALLVHGFPGTPFEMRPLADMLHTAGWTAQVLLLPGFGPQINDLMRHTHSDWLNTVTDAINELKRTHSPVILLGNSMGGALAIEAAAQVPVDGLVLLAPFYTLDHALWKLLPVLKFVIPTFKPFRIIKPDFSNPEMRQGILTYMPGADLNDPATQQAIREFSIPVRLFDHIRTAGQNAYKAAPNITAPALIIQGDRDRLVTGARTKELTQRLKGRVKYVEVKAEHDLIRPDRPAWNTVKLHIMQFVDTIT